MALIIGVCLFVLNRVLISNIREETTLRAKESAEVLSEMLNDSSDKGVLLKHYGKFIESLNFPIIISNTQGNCVTHKINIDKYKDFDESNPFINCEELNDIINDMDEKNIPIPITYADNEVQRLDTQPKRDRPATQRRQPVARHHPAGQRTTQGDRKPC